MPLNFLSARTASSQNQVMMRCFHPFISLLMLREINKPDSLLIKIWKLRRASTANRPAVATTCVLMHFTEWRVSYYWHHDSTITATIRGIWLAPAQLRQRAANCSTLSGAESEKNFWSSFLPTRADNDHVPLDVLKQNFSKKDLKMLFKSQQCKWRFNAFVLQILDQFAQCKNPRFIIIAFDYKPILSKNTFLRLPGFSVRLSLL